MIRTWNQVIAVSDCGLTTAQHEESVGRHGLAQPVKRATTRIRIEVEQHVAAQYQVELTRRRCGLEDVVHFIAHHPPQ